MAQVINTNMMSLMAQNSLNKSQNALSTSIQRLSTGLRINGAKDDAAGQGIANRFTSQIRGLTQAARNANDGISLTQTLEDAYSQINDNLQRVRELAVQGLNATNTKDDLSSIMDEIKKRGDEIGRITEQVSFNGINLFEATRDFKFQVGANDNQIIAVTTQEQSRSIIFDDIQTAATTDLVENRQADSTVLGKIDEKIKVIDEARGKLGATQNCFEATVSEIQGRTNNLSASRSRIEDADYAVEVSNMTRAQILQQAGTSVLAQANQVPQNVLSLLQ